MEINFGQLKWIHDISIIIFKIFFYWACQLLVTCNLNMRNYLYDWADNRMSYVYNTVTVGHTAEWWGSRCSLLHSARVQGSLCRKTYVCQAIKTYSSPNGCGMSYSLVTFPSLSKCQGEKVHNIFLHIHCGWQWLLPHLRYASQWLLPLWMFFKSVGVLFAFVVAG